MDGSLEVFVVSDATGATAESVVTSVLLQFADAHPRIRRFPFVRTVGEVQAIVAEASAGRCLVVFTLVLPDLRRAMLASGRANGVTVVDLIGPLMAIFAGILQRGPSEKPGTHDGAHADLHRVTEAMPFDSPEYSAMSAGRSVVLSRSSSRHCRRAVMLALTMSVCVWMRAMTAMPTMVLPAPQGRTTTPQPPSTPPPW